MSLVRLNLKFRSANQVITRLFKSNKILSNQIHTRSVLFKGLEEEFTHIKIHNEVLQFPNVWLRDNCQCNQCYHPSANSRILDWSKFDLNPKPLNVVNDDHSVLVIWEDGHESRYNHNWLKFRSFTSEHQKRYTEIIYKPVKSIWHGNNFPKVCAKHNYNQILESNEALYNWLQDLSIYGIALIEDAPHSETALDSIVDRVAFPRKTHYGLKFVVQHVANTSNVAYLSSNLQMHTDLPYYEYCPGTNMLHCLVQTQGEGGENLLSDCHYTAKYMAEHHPEEFKLLTEIEVEWRDVGIEHNKEFFKLHRSPVICLDKHGEIVRINFSIPQRGSQFPGPIEKVKPWYEAHSLFYELSYKFAARFKTKAGNILVFDNIRVLHGRNQYEDKGDNVRKLIGAYVDWDEIYSKLRCLKLQLNLEDGIQ